MAEEDNKLSPAAEKQRQIKEVKTKLGNLSPTAAAEAMESAVAAQARKQVSGFGDFLRDQGVVGIGIGLVFGIQIKAVVDVIMSSFINPITTLLPGSTSLAERASTWEIVGKKAAIGWGAIVYSLITFVIVAAIIYATYKGLKLDKFKKQDKK